jgi:hypothetical protein
MLRFLRDHPVTSIGLVLGSLLNVGSRVNEAYSFLNAGLPVEIWEAIGAAIFFLSVIVLLYRWRGTTNLVASGTIVPLLQAGGPNASPLAEITKTVPNARLRLLMRPQQDPEELTNENVYRWFCFRSLAKKADTGEVQHIATYIFLVFRHPVMPNYKRAFSPTHPNLRLEAIDTTSRSMVIIVDNDDPTSATLEMQLSEKPI